MRNFLLEKTSYLNILNIQVVGCKKKGRKIKFNEIIIPASTRQSDKIKANKKLYS